MIVILLVMGKFNIGVQKMTDLHQQSKYFAQKKANNQIFRQCDEKFNSLFYYFQLLNKTN